MTTEDIVKRRKVIEMMTSMHSCLFDRNRLKAKILDVFLISISVFLLAFSFIDPMLLKHFGYDEFFPKIVIGLIGVIISTVSLLSYIVDWKSRSTSHEQAFRSLLGLKTEWTIFENESKVPNMRKYLALESKTSLIMSQMIPISDKLFNRLKSKHYKKVLISKTISAHPGASPFLVNLNIIIRDTRKALLSR